MVTSHSNAEFSQAVNRLLDMIGCRCGPPPFFEVGLGEGGAWWVELSHEATCPLHD